MRGNPEVTRDLRVSSYNELISGSFRATVSRFVTAFCNAHATLEHGACDRLLADTDEWPITGASRATVPSTTTPDTTAGHTDDTAADTEPGTTTTRRSSSTSTTAAHRSH